MVRKGGSRLLTLLFLRRITCRGCARVRMLEENFLLPIVTRELESPMRRWRREVAADLDRPKYKTEQAPELFERLAHELNFMVIKGQLILPARASAGEPATSGP